MTHAECPGMYLTATLALSLLHCLCDDAPPAAASGPPAPSFDAEERADWASGPPRRPAPPPPPRRGIGMLASGGVLTASGAALGTAGLVALMFGGAQAPMGQLDRVYAVSLPMLVPGVLAFAGGVTLLAIGGVRHNRWKVWHASTARRWGPSPGRTPYGTWTLGVTLRF